MTFEGINSAAPIFTALVIAATAAAALVQLRHMRASNHITAMWSIHQQFSDPRYLEAVRDLREHLFELMEDAAFREIIVRRIQGRPTPNAKEQYNATAASAMLVLNTHETLGNMIITGLVDRDVFMRNYAWIIDANWRRYERYIALCRQAEQGNGLYGDFEWLTVYARNWIKRNPVAYPKGYARILPSFERGPVA